MIISLRLNDFKNFADETLRIGPFTVIVGTNASGKSNIRDAFRFLHGIGQGYTLADIIGGKFVGGQREWEQIRGAPNEIVRSGQQVFFLQVMAVLDSTRVEFLIIFRPELLGAGGFRVGFETLLANGQKVYEVKYTASDVHFRGFDAGIMNLIRRDQPVLTQLNEFTGSIESGCHIESAIDAFVNMRFLDLIPDRMRQPSIPGQTILGNSGENLATVLQALCADPLKKDVLSQWTRELTPMDVDKFEFPEGPDGKVHLILQERSGREISAHSASDGTLRFLAMLAALLGPDLARLYFFEEIDNGIHPSRLNLLIDLIEQQTAKGTTQVIATTHSPQLLSMISDTTFENTSVICRLEDSEDAIIRPVAELPNAKELRKSQGLGRLLAGGWMETALNFTEGDKSDEERSK